MIRTYVDPISGQLRHIEFIRQLEYWSETQHNVHSYWKLENGLVLAIADSNWVALGISYKDEL